MAGSLGNKARSLELSRGLAGAAVAPVAGLVWSDVVERVDVAQLVDGERVVRDYTITRRSADYPAVAEVRERITRDPEELGRVLAPDGRAIGRVKVSRRGGVVLEYTWPEDLAIEASS